MSLSRFLSVHSRKLYWSQNWFLHLLGIGAAPVDRLQSGGTAWANDGQQEQGTAAPCAAPHPRKKSETGYTEARYHKPATISCPCMSPVAPGARKGHVPEWNPTKLRVFLLRLFEMFHIVRNWLENYSCDEIRVLRTERVCSV